MKFETILRAYTQAVIDLAYDPLDIYRKPFRLKRQCAAFLARLEEMYKEKSESVDYFNRRYRALKRVWGELEIEQAYYHGVDVGLEVADPELYGEDHVAL